MPPPNVARILIVDADPESRRRLFRSLERSGYDCLTAETGASAVNSASLHSPDLLILDLRLPDMTGFEVISLLKKDPALAETPLIVSTGETHAVDLLRSAAQCLGVRGFLIKPASLDALLREITAALGSRTQPDSWRVQHGPILIDLRGRTVEIEGRPLPLGPKRLETLLALARSRDGLSARILGSLVWSPDEPVNTVAKTVNRLRHDLRRALGRDVIVSIPGGYKLQ